MKCKHFERKIRLDSGQTLPKGAGVNTGMVEENKKAYFQVRTYIPFCQETPGHTEAAAHQNTLQEAFHKTASLFREERL
jgi:hypothetical protein